jgi:hypothetical protein
LAVLSLTQSTEYHLHYTKILLTLQDMIEDNDLDGFMALEAYKVMTTLAGTTLTQA